MRRRAMSRWLGAALIVALAVLFLIVNRGAYKGYFSGDDLDNMAIVRLLPARQLVQGIVELHLHELNPRMAGFLLYSVLENAAGLDYTPYLAVLHALHLLNACLLYLLLRKLDLAPFAAVAGLLFWLFHAGTLEAYWKPMYFFDVLLALFSLLCLLAYIHGRYVLSFVCFWLAYRSKEPALMLPAVLFCYEYLLGGKRWRRVAPFLCVSLLLGVQSVIVGAGADRGDYRVSLALPNLWKTTAFYSSQVLLVPFAGLTMFALPLVLRDRRLYLGLAACCLPLLPMLVLPGRLSGAYLYAPLIGVALVVATVAALPGRWRVPLTFAALMLWAPLNHAHLRATRNTLLAEAAVNRQYVSALKPVVAAYPKTRTFICDSAPRSLNSWGVTGALRLLYGEPVTFHWLEQAGLADAVGGSSLVLLHWDGTSGTLTAVSRHADERPRSFIEFDPFAPVWQLRDGWVGRDGPYSWIRPRARARLWRPEGAGHFELISYAGADLLGRCAVRIVVNGQPLGERPVEGRGQQRLRWQLKPGEPGPAEVEIQVERARPAAGEPLGVPVMGFGFCP